MPFGNPVVGQEDLIRDAIRSTNYVSGVSGWRIAKNGNAEFNEGTFRSELDVTGGDGSFIRAQLSGGHADLLLQPQTIGTVPFNPARLTTSIDSSLAPDYAPQLVITGPFGDDATCPPGSITLWGPTPNLIDNTMILDTQRLIVLNTGDPAAYFASGALLSVEGSIAMTARIFKPVGRGSASASVAALPRSTAQKVAIDTADIDTDIGFDLVNHRYVFPRLGYWRISYSVTLDSFTTPTGTPSAEAWLDLNGVGGPQYAREITPVNAASDTLAMSGTEIVEVTALTDYVELFTRYNNGTAGTTYRQLSGSQFPTLTVEFVG